MRKSGLRLSIVMYVYWFALEESHARASSRESREWRSRKRGPVGGVSGRSSIGSGWNVDDGSSRRQRRFAVVKKGPRWRDDVEGVRMKDEVKSND